nr:hypothetical protein [Tanacetum cinerariifolium]
MIDIHSEHSTVTYTSISSDDGSSDIGYPGVIVLGYNGLPMMLEDPYAHEDLEEEDDEDPKEDPTDYPTNRDDEEEESSGDDVDDEEEDVGEDENEHLASVDSIPPLAYRTTARISIRAHTPISFPSEIEVGKLLAIPTPPPLSLISYSSPLLQIPSP